jgi:hypothetical protein
MRCPFMCGLMTKTVSCYEASTVGSVPARRTCVSWKGTINCEVHRVAMELVVHIGEGRTMCSAVRSLASCSLVLTHDESTPPY